MGISGERPYVARMKQEITTFFGCDFLRPHSKKPFLPMTTLIEKDSPVSVFLILGVLFLVGVLGVLGVAYLGGVFTTKDDVIRNDKRIAAQALQNAPPPAKP